MASRPFDTTTGMRDYIPPDIDLAGLLHDVNAILYESDAGGAFSFVSDATFSILGYEPAQWIADARFWVAHIHPDDLDAATKQRAAALPGDPHVELEYRIKASDGRFIWVRDRVRAVRRDGGAMMLRGSLVDVTQHKEVEQRLKMKDAVTSVLAESPTLEEAAGPVLRATVECLEWDHGALWLVDSAAGVLRCVDVCRRDDGLDSFEKLSRESTFRPGVGLPGRVWSAGEASWISDVARDANLPRAAEAARAGLHGAFGFPVRAAGEVLGVIECLSRDIRPPDANLLALMSNIGSQIGQFIERVQAHAALVESEERFRIMADSAPVMVWMSGTDTGTTFFNAKWLEFTGRSLEDELSDGWIKGLHPADVESYMATYRSSFEARREFRIEYRLRHADGNYRWVLSTGAPRLAAGGRFAGYIGSCIDITERRDAEDALIDSGQRLQTLTEATAIEVDDRKRAERRVSELNAELQRRLAELEAVLDVVPVGIAIAEDPACRAVRVNAAYSRLFGNPPAVGQGSAAAAHAGKLPFRVLRDGREVSASERPLELAAKDGTTFSALEFEVLRPGKEPIHLLEYAAPMLDERDQIVGSVGAFVDITQRKRAEEGERFLAEASSLLAATLDYETTLSNLSKLAVPRIADICVIDIIETDGDVRRLAVAPADPSLEALVPRLRIRDWRLSAGSAQTLGEAMPLGRSVFVRKVTDEWLREITPDEEHFRLAKRMQATSLIFVPLRARDRLLGVLSLIMTDSGRSYDASQLALANDLAHRAAIAVENARLYRAAQQTAEDLQQANNAKDEFLGIVSHELRTPITTIYGNADVLRRRGDELTDEDRRAAVLDIEQESERLARLVDNIFVLAHVERGREVEAEPLFVRRVVDAVFAEHHRRHPKRELKNEVAGDVPLVAAAPTYVEQVLRNLIGNAEKYSPPEPSVDVRAVQNGEFVEISVLDRGSGIDDSEAEAVFGAFYRSTRNAGDASGTGIGLAVCRRLVEAQGGTIEARPRAGGGTEIRFTLPVDKES